MGPKSLAIAALLLTACGGSASSAKPEAPPHKHEHSAHQKSGGHGHHRFDKAEDWVGRFEGPERDEWQKPTLVIEAMQIQPGMVLADVGAGTGYFLPHLVAATGPKGRVIGLDIEADMVRYMSERIARENIQGAEARICKLDDPGLEPGSTDRILIVNTWHHIADRVAYSGKLAAALREDGELYIVDFTLESPHGPPKEMRLRAEDVIAELKAAGMSAQLVESALPNQWILRARKR